VGPTGGLDVFEKKQKLLSPAGVRSSYRPTRCIMQYYEESKSQHITNARGDAWM